MLNCVWGMVRVCLKIHEIGENWLGLINLNSGSHERFIYQGENKEEESIDSLNTFHC